MKISMAFVVVCFCAASGWAADGDAPRNVLLYVVDDQGMNDAGCMGNPVIRTPGLDTTGRDEVFLSHTFHEITMYYPVRVLRERQYKLTWNIASGLEFPFASDLYASETWQAILKNGATHYGKRTVDAYLHRDAFELFDLVKDPDELLNLAGEPDYAPILMLFKVNMRYPFSCHRLFVIPECGCRESKYCNKSTRR